MRFVAVLLVALACSDALASQPGQRLDCSDWIISKPGITCTQVIPPDCSATDACRKGSNIAMDNQGNLFTIRRVTTGTCGAGGDTYGHLELVMLSGQTESIIATLYERCATILDRAKPNVCDTDSCRLNEHMYVGNALTFDPMGGRLLIPIESACGNGGAGCPPDYGGGLWLAAFTGFPTMFDVLQSYVPQPAALNFAVPYMPDGLPAADHFDTYWGPLAHPIDFAQAHPLQCDYPGTPPHVGDYITVTDPLPDPAPGSGYYYVTAATYQGQTRYGRKTTAGHLSGRDPAVLPLCSRSTIAANDTPR